ncbi:MAG: PAS domain S-box protein [Gammaproteobacteria bacterium]|nr:PAS domain S-box protein [Gammaproteobacteria bacterium]
MLGRTDNPLQVERRPFFSASLLVPLALIVVACGALFYYGHEVASTIQRSVEDGARAQGQATAHEIRAFIQREHERLDAFVEEKRDPIRSLLAYPDDWPAIDNLQSSLKRLFRGAIAFTITGPDGKPVFEDFDGLVGEVCQNEMRRYAGEIGDGRLAPAIPPIHPVPGAYHFDLITPWRLNGEQWGLFFVSMQPDRIAELIAAAGQASGMRLLLVNRLDPTLIEVSADGARDRLSNEIRLEPEALEVGHFATDIEGTHWRLLVLPDNDALARAVSLVYVKVAVLVVALLLISAALLLLIRRSEQRNSSLFTRSLQSSVGRQRAILQSMVDGMVTIDAEGKVLNVNNAVTRLFGYEAGELIGSNVSKLMPEPDRSSHDGYLRHYIATGESRILGKGREVMGMHKDGRLFPVLLTLGESMEGDERIFVGILHDMTAFRDAQRKIDAQADALRRTNQELEEISQMASKDLQLPLMRIASLSESLGTRATGGGLSGDEQAQLQSLTNEARDMSEIVRGLAHYAHVEDAPGDQSVALDDVLGEVRADLAAAIEAAGAEVVADELPVVLGDARQLRQLFWNLVDNAIKFRDPARPARIEVVLQDASPAGDAGSMAVILVRDNGLGFPGEHAEKVFDAFVRLHPREQYPGTGLGLSFCRKIVERFGGRISVSSAVGEGSTFRVELPLAPVAQ